MQFLIAILKQAALQIGVDLVVSVFQWLRRQNWGAVSLGRALA